MWSGLHSLKPANVLESVSQGANITSPTGVRDGACRKAMAFVLWAASQAQR